MEQDNQRRDTYDKLQDIMLDYGKQEDTRQKARIQAQERNKIREKVIFYMRCFGIFFSLVTIIYIFSLAFAQQQKISRKPLWVMGMQRPSDYHLRGCIANLWKIRGAIDLFYAENKRFPRELTELYDGGFLSGKLECPASRQEYTINIVSGKRVIACPDSLQHGASSVKLYIQSGPPIIERR